MKSEKVSGWSDIYSGVYVVIASIIYALLGKRDYEIITRQFFFPVWRFSVVFLTGPTYHGVTILRGVILSLCMVTIHGGMSAHRIRLVGGLK
jgi:hypothetical protein